MVISSMRRTLLATTIIAGTLIAMPVYAQTPVAAADAAVPEGDTIVVTGSLLTNPNLQQSAPVNVTTAAEIQLRQSNVAEEVLRDIPGIVPSIGSAVNNGNGGASFVDLRGLGSFRNIVLLDGYRIVPAGLEGRVDLNNIPLALVERVDTLTGGASTTYGADAVSGVVNFITRKDFSGAEVSAGAQINEQGDGNYNRLDVTIGANFDDGRGNAVFSVGYQQSDPVYQGDRDYSVNNVDSFSGTLGGSGTGVPSRISGTRPIDPVTGLPSTNPATPNGGVRQINPTTGQAVATYAPFNFNPYNIFQTPFTRYNMYGAAHYQVSDAVELYTRGMFSKNIVKTIIAPSGVFGSSVAVPLSNPYLPAATRAQYCAFNVAPVDATTGTQLTYTPRLSVAACNAAATALTPTSPGYTLANFTLNRRLVEGGPRVSSYQTTMFDYRVGARGGITDAINWDVAGSYGESENRQALQGYVLTSRARQALLATNTTTCLDTSNNCVPLNIFGAAGSITPAQAAFLQAESTSTVTTSLAQARAIINGDVGVSSPFASDSINFAVGGEFRKYKATQRSDLLAKTAGELGGAGGAAPDIDGGYDVYEALAEVNVPLVQDKPFFDSLSVEAGIRYSHYTIDTPTKPKFNTTTYKFGGSWSPVKDIKIRGGYAHSVRAPNISELFTPVTTGLTNQATDPCAGLAPVTNANLRAICIAQGAPANTIGSILNPTAGQANVTTGGNLNLKPEKSNSYTFGTVVTPSMIPGFSMTVDYYNITVKEAITTPNPGDIVAACFANITAASASSVACAQLGRNPTTGGLDGDPATTLGLIAQQTNAGRLKTDGIDVAANYRRDLGFAKLSLSITGNYTFRSKFQASSDAINRECVGFYSANCASIQPKFSWNQRTTLTFGDVDVSLLWRHINKVKQEPQDVIDTGPAFVGVVPGYGNVDFGHIPSFDYFDVTTRFGITDMIDLTVGIQNIANRKPPIVGSTIGSTSYNSGNTYPSTYDSLGRRYAVGVKAKF
jgi:outer membrane receptor protein involved in Fe transport